ncbi:hypothetical protein AARAC_000449 [Aspergillus arachidicola]|uniref:AMP-dependent synthetase/ligase domain-containing protein n=1 Tax=Aspergillus arachidicola TaxID=656916 RepID=A0A2G7FGU5_9EURO|nr:hypothetical protein AARAC_000449 [Aspergillus arachidicola]
MSNKGSTDEVNNNHQFPNDFILAKFLEVSRRFPGPMIHDEYGFDKSYAHLLGDAFRTRDDLIKALPPSNINEHGLLHDDHQYICVLARSGYEFLVAFFAIRALGGACIPFGSGILPEEAQYFLSDANSCCLLVGHGLSDRAHRIGLHVKNTTSLQLTTLPISHNAEPLDGSCIEIANSLRLDPSSPGLVLFTSGSTGPPKGAVLPKRCFTFDYTAKRGDATISYRPSHWVGGAESLIEAAVTGTKLYVLKERSGPDAVWEIFKNHTITHVLCTPTLLRTMKEFFAESICLLSPLERAKYIQGFQKMSKISCCSAMIAPSVLQFWKDLTGLPFENVYGSTEMGGAVTRASTNSLVQFSIGIPCSGVEVKLSEGDQGEILARSSWMLTHYIGNEQATKVAFDDDGFFKTGDLAQDVNGEYVFTGRATSDYIFYHGFRIATLPVENHLTDLPYVTEACVLGVPDHEAKQLCGAIIRCSKDTSSQVSLHRVRSDLSKYLPTYMLPALLRVLKDTEEIPRTISQKPIKKLILRDFFGVTDYWSIENPTPGVETCGNLPPQREATTRPWDWCGLQRAD